MTSEPRNREVHSFFLRTLLDSQTFSGLQKYNRHTKPIKTYVLRRLLQQFDAALEYKICPIGNNDRHNDLLTPQHPSRLYCAAQTYPIYNDPENEGLQGYQESGSVASPQFRYALSATSYVPPHIHYNLPSDRDTVARSPPEENDPHRQHSACAKQKSNVSLLSPQRKNYTHGKVTMPNRFTNTTSPLSVAIYVPPAHEQNRTKNRARKERAYLNLHTSSSSTPVTGLR